MIVQGVSQSNGAKDPSKMTDAELDHFLAGAEYGKQVASGQKSGMNAPQKDPSKMSDAELDAFIASKQPPWIDQSGQGQGYVKGAINALPTLGGIGGGLLGGGSAGPIGAVAGSGLGYGGGEAAKNSIYSYLGSKDAPQTSKEALLGPVEKIPQGMAQEMGGQIIGKAASKVLPRIASAAANVPEQDLNTLTNNTDEVRGLINETEGKVSGKIDEARGDAANSLKAYKDGLNQNIKKSLESYGPEKTVDINPILESIDRAKKQVNPKLNPELIADIDAIQKRVSDLTDGSNKASISEINDIRSYLGDLGSGTAPKPTGEGKFFAPKDPGSRAAYYGSGAASDLLKQNAPEVGETLSKFGELRKLTKQVTPGLLKEGANDVGFLGAGRGAAIRNEDMLKKIDELTGSNILSQAQKLSAAKNFGDTKLNPLSLYSGGLLKNPAILREAVFANDSLGGAPAAAAQFSTRPILDKATPFVQQFIPHRPDVKEFKTLGHGK